MKNKKKIKHSNGALREFSQEDRLRESVYENVDMLRNSVPLYRNKDNSDMRVQFFDKDFSRLGNIQVWNRPQRWERRSVWDLEDKDLAIPAEERRYRLVEGVSLLPKSRVYAKDESQKISSKISKKEEYNPEGLISSGLEGVNTFSKLVTIPKDENSVIYNQVRKTPQYNQFNLPSIRNLGRLAGGTSNIIDITSGIESIINASKNGGDPGKEAAKVLGRMGGGAIAWNAAMLVSGMTGVGLPITFAMAIISSSLFSLLGEKAGAETYETVKRLLQ